MNKSARIAARSRAISTYWLQLTASTLFAAAVTVLLVLGIRGANELQTASSAMQLASQLSAQPQLIAAQLTLIQRGLETTTYVGASLRNVMELRHSSTEAFAQLRSELQEAHLMSDADMSASLQSLLTRWQSLDTGLENIRDQRGTELYVDTPSGSQLSAQGKAMKAAVDTLLATQSQNLQQMGVDMRLLGAQLRTAVDTSGLRLRALLLGGTALAVLMLLLVLYHAWRSRLARRAAAQAEQQVANILSTVREGLFLVDRNMCLSATHSDSLRDLLHLPVPAGLPMEQLLEPLVDAKTISAALKYLGLLWKDKVHEELIESVNPLSEVEVSFANGRGGSEVRYLAFSFRRVRSADAAGDYILGAVADVTDRVLLARELESVKSESDSQATLQLQLLRADPEPLFGFLSAADVALRKSNAVLTTPGIEQEDLKKKLNGVFRELHAVKGEAAALTLNSFVQRIHAIEDALSALRGRTPLSGNDFLPIVVKLDELISHLAQTRAMQERIATLRELNRPSAEPDADTDNHRDTTVLAEKPVLTPNRAPTRAPLAQAPAVGAAPAAAPAPSAPAAAASASLAPPRPARSHLLTDMLNSLVQEEARAQGRSIRLVTRGLEDIPLSYASVIKDICIQMIRNSVAHGIEPPEQRLQGGKPEEGTVHISFQADDTEECVLTVEDDGNGLDYEQIVDKALRLDLISPQQAVGLDRASIYRLIFQPGFSTTEEVSEHAGRGVGLDAVSNLVREHGGKIGVSTSAGKYTRFRVLLPRTGSGSLSAPSAA